MTTASGYITAVQEQRFRLVTDDGHALLLTLSHKAPFSGQDLCLLHDNDTRVTVEYEGEPNLASAVAYAIEEL